MKDVEHLYCPACNHKIRLTHSAEHRDGHANLPDGAKVVCLDFGEGCSDGACPLTGTPGVVMGVRLARSGMADESFDRVSATCNACGQPGELKVIDENYALCPSCGSTNRWVRLDVGPERFNFTVS